MASKELATDFDDEISGVAVETLPPSTGKDELGVPYCVKHHCRMKQTSGGKKGSAVAYFACPVDGCEEKVKRIKTSKPIIPADPHLCPRCHNIKPRPTMERDAKLSNMMFTILRCPCCSHKTAPMPRPEFVQNHAESRGFVNEPDLGAR